MIIAGARETNGHASRAASLAACGREGGRPLFPAAVAPLLPLTRAALTAPYLRFDVDRHDLRLLDRARVLLVQIDLFGDASRGVGGIGGLDGRLRLESGGGIGRIGWAESPECAPKGPRWRGIGELLGNLAGPGPKAQKAA